MGLKFQHGTPDTLHIALLPLKKAGKQIMADMQGAGTGKRCGVCGKPFNSASEKRSLARVVYGDGSGAVMMLAWALCGKCTHVAVLNGGTVPESLRQEAEAIHEATRLITAEPKGMA